MADPARELESKVLRLPTKERARLAEKLLASLEGTAEPEADERWLAEAERRLAELKAGSAAGITAQEVSRKSRESLR